MRIGVIGTGRMGSTLGTLWAKAGHEIMFSLPRDANTLRTLLESIGPLASSGTPQEAVQFGDVLLLAVLWERQADVLRELGSLQGKILIDVSNPFKKEGDTWAMAIPDGKTAGEITAQRAHDARVVKAYNTMRAESFRDKSRPVGPEQLVVFLSGDDWLAKETVATLIRDSGFAPVDLGPMRNVSLQEAPNGPFYVSTSMSEDKARALLAELHIQG